MNSWDKSYMNKPVSKPEPEKEPDDTWAYIAGGVISVVSLVYFCIWLFEGLLK